MAFMEMKDKVPPHNLDAEQAVMGALLLDNRAIDRIDTGLVPEDFYKISHQKIYRSMLNLIRANKPSDMITLIDELRSNKDLELVGGATFIAQLTQATPSSANVAYHSGIVKECSLRRELIRIASDMAGNAFDESKESGQTIDTIEKEVFNLSVNRKQQGFRSVKEIIPEAVSRIEQAFNNKNTYTGVPSGFSKLDAMTSGFQESDYIVIGARPSMGKTALALSMAAHIAIKEHIPTAFFTLEMSDLQIMQRLIAMEARINSLAMRNGMLKPADFASIGDAAGRIYDAPLWISDWPNMPILEIKSQARILVKDQGVKIIFVDYLGLISAERPELARWEQMSEVSRTLKALARELKVPVVVLSQVTRDSEGKEPNLSNIRESGAIEQDADMVMFIHRDKSSDQESDKQTVVAETKLIVAKQRNGPIGTVRIGYHNNFTRFVEIEEHH